MNEKLESIVENIEATVIELGKNVSEYQLQMAWEVGKIIRESEESPTELIAVLAKDERMKHVKMGERSLWKAVGIFDFAPTDFKLLFETPLGLSVSVNKILALNKEKVECLHENTVLRCSSCGKTVHEA